MKVVFVHHVGLLPDRARTVEQLRVTVLEGFVLHPPRDVVEEFLRLDIQCLTAVHAEVELPRRLFVAPRAADGGEVLGFIGLDFLPVGASVPLLEALLAEVGHVPSGVFGAALAPLSVLDLGLTQPAVDQPARVRLPEVRRRDVLLDVDTVGGVLEDLEPGVVARPFWRGELAPERRRVVVSRWMVSEPALDVGDRDDEVDGALALLPVDVDAEGVVAVEDVADAEVEELATAQATLELQGQQCGIASVERGVDHWFDLGLPAQHVALAGDGVEVVRGARRDPLQGLRRLVALQTVGAERAQRGSVVLIRVLVGVLAVDPADDRLGDGTELQGRTEQAVLFEDGVDVIISLDIGRVGLVVLDERVDAGRRREGGHPAAVPEQLQVAVFPDLRGDESDVVAHPQEVAAVGVELDVDVAALQPGAESVGFVARVGVGHDDGAGRMDCKVGADFRPLAYTLSLTIQESEGIRSSFNPHASSGDTGGLTGVSA